MVTVAVIGGTGSVGKTIVEAFLAEGTHEVVVVSRKDPEGKSVAKVLAVDYTNVDQLTKMLEKNNIHTVISAIVMYDPAAAQSERNFIAAADKSSCTKRFVASNWGNATPEDPSLRLELNGLRDPSLAALRKTGLEWTQFYVGLFLDYYGMPHIPSHLTPLVVFIDMAHKIAALPGTTGDELVSFTYTQDLGKFVVAAMSLEHWPEALHCYSENTSLSRLLQIAEDVRGSKFTVTFDPVERLARDEVTELPSHPYLYPYFPKRLLMGLIAKFGLWAVNGIMFVPHEGSLNEKFPDIQTKSAKDVIGAWKGK